MPYQIIEVKEHPIKFAAMVKFTESREAEYYEVDSTDPASVDATLAKAAAECEVQDVQPEKAQIEVQDGKIVIPPVEEVEKA